MTYNITFAISIVPGTFATGVTAKINPTIAAIVTVQVVPLITAPTSGSTPPIYLLTAEMSKDKPNNPSNSLNPTVPLFSCFKSIWSWSKYSVFAPVQVLNVEANGTSQYRNITQRD